MGYLPGYATPRIVCDVPYVGKRWVHQLAEYDRELGISYYGTHEELMTAKAGYAELFTLQAQAYLDEVPS